MIRVSPRRCPLDPHILVDAASTRRRLWRQEPADRYGRDLRDWPGFGVRAAVQEFKKRDPTEQAGGLRSRDSRTYDLEA